MGATGVPVCGDPGWERANRAPDHPVEYQRDYYGAAHAVGRRRAPAPEPGRKRIRWYAERVHHFAMSLNPAYRYEGGHFGDVAVHVLYQPGDEKTWGGGIAVERTQTALAWLDQLYGPFGWPQITNVHRIEGGGTEFPMMIHDGSADQGLIVHELGHNYTMGILANNEWREGWLDEGFTSFQTSWFWETMGRPSYGKTEAQVLELDLDGYSEPPSLVAEDYRDFTSYNIAIYTRGELFFHQLRAIVGDATMHRILQTFYERWKYHHVDEAAFRVGRRGGLPPGPLDLLCPVAAHDRAVRLRDRPGEDRRSRARAISRRWKSCGSRPDGFPRMSRSSPRATRPWRARMASPSASGWRYRRGRARRPCCSIRWCGRTTGTCSTTGSRWAPDCRGSCCRRRGPMSTSTATSARARAATG